MRLRAHIQSPTMDRAMFMHLAAYLPSRSGVSATIRWFHHVVRGQLVEPQIPLQANRRPHGRYRKRHQFPISNFPPFCESSGGDPKSGISLRCWFSHLPMWYPSIRHLNIEELHTPIGGSNDSTTVCYLKCNFATVFAFFFFASIRPIIYTIYTVTTMVGRKLLPSAISGITWGVIDGPFGPGNSGNFKTLTQCQ